MDRTHLTNLLSLGALAALLPGVTSSQALSPSTPAATRAAASASVGFAAPTLSDLRVELRKLATKKTEWRLWQDVCEKMKPRGSQAMTAIDLEWTGADELGNAITSRYRVRLARVLTDLHPKRGLSRLAEFLRDPDASVISLAARAAGLSKASPAEIARVLTPAYKSEQWEERGSTQEAIILAMGDSGHVPFFDELVAKLKYMRGFKLGLAEARAAQISLTRLATRSQAPKARSWLKGEHRNQLAGILISKKLRDALALPDLKKIASNRRAANRVAAIAAIGAIGSEAARDTLRALLKNKPKGKSRDFIQDWKQPYYLAFLRTGHSSSVSWAEKKLDAGADFVDPETDGLVELAAKWKVGIAKEWLANSVRNINRVNVMRRVHTGRGLCWLGDPKGLDILIDMLDSADNGYFEVDAAQAALFDFVSNVDRPDYHRIAWRERRITTYRRELALKIQAEWKAWLTAHRTTLQWRRPVEATEDWLLFY